MKLLEVIDRGKFIVFVDRLNPFDTVTYFYILPTSRQSYSAEEITGAAVRGILKPVYKSSPLQKISSKMNILVRK